MFAVLMIILTFIIVLGFSVQPLFLPRKQNQDEEKSKIVVLKLLKESIYGQIKELEMEYEMGTVSPSDFQRNRNELKLEASSILDKLKSFGKTTAVD
ncbi:MAG: hypothetical protein ACJZ02_00345 [Candidatus Neomarinimicrobiota bacterium]